MKDGVYLGFTFWRAMHHGIGIIHAHTVGTAVLTYQIHDGVVQGWKCFRVDKVTTTRHVACLRVGVNDLYEVAGHLRSGTTYEAQLLPIVRPRRQDRVAGYG